jgi:hypothetical protein
MAKIEPGVFRIICVRDGRAACDCNGYDGKFCSHIDATLVAGERAMVPDADHSIADQAMMAVAGKIRVPADWKGSWRKMMQWRGLSAGRPRSSRTGATGLPIVCFTEAMPKSRATLLEESRNRGWEPVNTVHSLIDVLVAADPAGNSAKLTYARQKGIPILTYNEWISLSLDGELTAKT